MTRRAARLTLTLALTGALAACSGLGSGTKPAQPKPEKRESTLWDLFLNRNPSETVAVNKYLWNASLDVLNFLPVQTVDPFTGVIVTGYGTPPGGGRSYRATIRVTDPALDARSLQLSLEGAGGSKVAPGTVRAVEDAIMTRARQLRIQDGRL